MSEPYTLKEAVDENVLENLNDIRYEGLSVSGSMANKLFRAMSGKCRTEYVGIEQIEDWIAALKSGKKIVNPMSPMEELKKEYDSVQFFTDYRVGIRTAVKIIAKEHPDVADWLKDGDKDV